MKQPASPPTRAIAFPIVGIKRASTNDKINQIKVVMTRRRLSRFVKRSKIFDLISKVVTAALSHDKNTFAEIEF